MELLQDPEVFFPEELIKVMVPENADKILALTDAYSLVDVYGQVLACCGLVHFWKGRAEAWSVFKPNMGPKFISVAKMIREFLHNHPCERIESYISEDFKKGDQWMSFLGFKLEADNLRKYKDNKTYSLYSLIKGD